MAFRSNDESTLSREQTIVFNVREKERGENHSQMKGGGKIHSAGLKRVTVPYRGNPRMFMHTEM